jgi:hypothetical protein
MVRTLPVSVGCAVKPAGRPPQYVHIVGLLPLTVIAVE